MRKIVLKLFLTLSVLSLIGCSRSSDEALPSEDQPLTDQDYFDAAAIYIPASASFGAQTDLTNAISPKIEFSDSVLNPVYGLNNKLATPLTLRKEFIQSTDGKLIMLRRKLPSQLDGVTMTVGLRSGINRIRNMGNHETVTQCNAIVFNADGQAVCLVVSNNTISSAKIATKYGHRLIYSVADQGGGTLQVKSKKQFSIKTLSAGSVVNKKFNGAPVP